MSLQLRTGRAQRRARRREGARPLLLVLTALAAVAFAVIVYFVTTSIAWFASSPTSDPEFGTLNHCLLQALPVNRAGFAVSPDAKHAASFTGHALALCSDTGAPHAAVRTVPLEGVTQAAWDFRGTLWVAARGEPGPRLLRIPSEGAPVVVGDVSPVALTGHAHGVAALDASGRVVSLAEDGSALGFADLHRSPPQDSTLSADASGELIALVASGGVWAFRARDLQPVLAESPCDVQHLWWLKQPGVALVSCGADEGWALELNVLTGAREEAPRRERLPSVFVPQRGLYVRACESLPCTASPP